ncbi:Tudor/PWWP/MBT superfamily protein [Striga hermonthica]|uniref:Tudor/PWWP/MBT superfamily protein n=1 Tax=Striga hermonthica TaxID=68872 RepID=A0A9N7NGP6_STRHE|nr:Tudor/PWWP/MBT superfamily protein [Striga hermonthica]
MATLEDVGDKSVGKVSDFEKVRDGTSAVDDVVETEKESKFDGSHCFVDTEKVKNGVLGFAEDPGTNSGAKMNDTFGGGEKKGEFVVTGSPINANGVGNDDEKQIKSEEKCLEAIVDANGQKQGTNNGEKREDLDSTFRVGDFVWGKIKSHPWWPGQIYDPQDASEFAVKHSQEGRLLVAYFGDGSCSWCLPSQLVPFVENFNRFSTESSTKSFQNALHCAVNDVGRVVEQSMTCKCVPPVKIDGLARQLVSNAGVREGVVVPEVDIGRINVPKYEPAQILEKMTSYGKSNSFDSLLDLALVKSWLSAFYHAKGGHKLPMYREPVYIEGLEDKNEPTKEAASSEDFSVPIEVPILGPREDYWLSSPEVNKSQASADDKIYHRRKQKSVAELLGENNGAGSKSHERVKVKAEKDVGKKAELGKGRAGKKRKVEDLGGDKTENNEVKKGPSSGKPKEIEVGVGGEDISGDELEKIISSPRERKRSKYLSPPYTDPSFSLSSFGSKSKSESGKSSKLVDEASDEELPIAQLKDLEPSAQTVKGEKKWSLAASHVDLQVDELLSEVQFAAVDPLYLSKKGSLDPVCAFMSAVRKSTYLQGSDHEVFHKSKTGGKKRKSFKEQENEIAPKKAKSADNTKMPKPVKMHEGKKSDKPKVNKSSDFSRAKNSVEMNSEGSASTCLIVTFSPGFPLPSKEEILELFGKFGSLNENETDVLTESQAVRIVYTNESDAEKAFTSSVKESPFGIDNVNYWLQHSSAASKSGPLIFPRTSDKSGSSQQVDDFMMDFRAVGQKLEIMTAILENYHPKFSCEEKSGLKDDIKQLMENVEAMSDKVRVMAENTTS